ncbi:PBAN-type neuropeptides [Camponotus floridanus]|uniref:PBAN-type neuropeptides n=1 Tax=Camponotus floridanus TaxID=104421 RepID=PPK_CAMFO|nr:PBAN-type neuropeptides [Camponotus floridanus]E2AFK9.1 RecName: Full=PBAN-type neuropeptides; Contains: RecName: Full=Pyrokinin 1; Short=Pk 1; Contains: RecName: Full=Pyrokinin 2; Short=Pk 2; Contains: RecName: Full=Pyrokinin 3; Short=Pk 3; Contains: RecName: Full=Pyrokinin 4; Short=Pk 4; Flags: Precursor [Camponotus floridanus]EFN67760.1 PBAN-type neuropeptides [Camponotus floridanus]
MIVTGNPVCAIALLLCLVFRASGEYELEMSSGGSNDGRSPSNDFGSCTDGKCTKRTTTTQESGISSGMWFGPRLGKRHKSNEKQQINPEIEMLVNALDQPGMRWTVITIPANEKRQPTQFTPRLGRGSEEKFIYSDATDRNEIDEDDPLFTPRLGRRVPWIPSPRLGRQSRSVSRKI